MLNILTHEYTLKTETYFDEIGGTTLAFARDLSQAKSLLCLVL